ncbi:cytochrome c1, partial [Mesorhizobium sp. M00.F.Ca.ET.038.03.1.1]
MKKILTSLALLGLVVAGTWMSSAGAIAAEEEHNA